MIRTKPGILFVHGLDQGRGSCLETALRGAADAEGIGFDVFRWQSPSSSLGASLVVTGIQTLFQSGSVGTVLRATTARARHYWQRVDREVREAANPLASLIESCPMEPVSIIAYSLGARVACRALATQPWGPMVLRVVLVGSAATRAEVDRARTRGKLHVRLVNVYSELDTTLALQPLVDRRRRGSGLGPVAGVHNCRVMLGHGEYDRVATRLVALAVRPELTP